MLFVELPAFTAQQLFDDDALLAIQLQLLADPSAGDLIPRARGLRKLRAALPGRGKRGGARVIYYCMTGDQTCYLIFAYAKNRQSDLTPAQTKVLVELMQEVLRDG
ncbi:MAG: type II toxin-antitoxin system RelE/ParE family toxin [Proteobacteria bacterium]|nr:type II toxin-antitoxin system RelE/ParE family toxin [Pseudomonadota bacterium]